MAESNDDRIILCVGLLCVDIVSVMDGFPKEDSDQRVREMYWQRGGNASNSCTVLRQLGASCEYFGTVGVNESLGFLKSSLESSGIAYDHCVYHEGVAAPCSLVMINAENGSRTILHGNRDLPDPSLEDFHNVDLSSHKYKWIHFEGRTECTAMRSMLLSIDNHNHQVSHPSQRITTSVELEKCRESLDELLDVADYLFISKDYARFKGFLTKEEAVQGLAARCRPGACIICPWGSEGAVARTPGGQLVNSPSYPPARVVDTCGAGDTFLAATIVALSQGKEVKTAINFGCRVAGAKVGMFGYSGLNAMFSDNFNQDSLS